MNIYGYIRTSKAQESGHAGSDPEVQRQQLFDAGVEPRHIFSDVGISGAKGTGYLRQPLRVGSVFVEAMRGRTNYRSSEAVVWREA